MTRANPNLCYGRKSRWCPESHRASGDYDSCLGPRLVRQAIGIVDGLMRLSLGIEAIDDIMHNLAAALDTL